MSVAVIWTVSALDGLEPHSIGLVLERQPNPEGLSGRMLSAHLRTDEACGYPWSRRDGRGLDTLREAG